MRKLVLCLAFFLVGFVLRGEAAKSSSLGSCIYEVTYEGPPNNRLVVGWLHPPCDLQFDFTEDIDFQALRRNQATISCGKTTIYMSRYHSTPVADTFPSLCSQQRANDG